MIPSWFKYLTSRLRFQSQSRVLRSAKSLPVWTNYLHSAGYSLAGMALILLILQSGLQWTIPYPIHIAGRIIEILLFCIYMVDATLTWIYTVPKREYLQRHSLDPLTVLPFLLNLISLSTVVGFIIIRYFIVLMRHFTQTPKFTRMIQGIRFNTAQIVVFSFLTTILIGAILLTFPAATTDGKGASIVDAFFTATSATCVTGLIVQDTPTYFTSFGQIVILFLIQLGGLGIMTYSAFVALLFGRFTFGQRQMMQEMLDEDRNVYSMIFYIFRMTFIAELIGIIFLFSRWAFEFDSVMKAAYFSIFHSISAFCNAGFSLFSDSLMQYQGDPIINITIMALITLGGLGFIVVHDIGKKIKKRQALSPHSKLVLISSAILTTGGFLTILFFEFDGQMADLSMGERMWTALFQSVSARTAGFNTLNINELSRVTMAILTGLMFIGASPGSTGGGIKTSTFAVLLLSIKSTLLGRDRVETLKRTIPDNAVKKALALTVISGLTVLLVFILLMSWQPQSTISLFFETVSAFGTVGLSTGITADLTIQSRWLVAMLMFLGRIGPLTLGIALAQGVAKKRIAFPDARILIG
ncbi:hypothetical protein KAR48_06145 [bacterium]|nr:hypothetical protein [bacterium]